ncbi:MAG: Nramp family divalent metal transporter [archaeon]
MGIKVSISQRLKMLAVFLAIVGPGLITANVDNDAGGIATFSIAGSQFGYALLWALVPITVSLVVIQEMSARMGVVTGKGLADLIREKYGVKTIFFVMGALLLANAGTSAAEFAGVAAAGEILGFSKYLAVPLAAALVWVLVVKGNYKIVEKIFLFSILFYFSYVISAFLVPGMNWGVALKSLVTPSIQFSTPYLTVLIALIGTNITPWMQFYLQSSIVEKGIKLKDYKYSRLDVIVGCIMTDVISFFIIVATAATLFAAGIPVESAGDAARALAPLDGNYAAILFSFGLLNASLLGAAVIPLTTAYHVCEGFGWEAGINKKLKDAPAFYTLFTITLLFGVAVVLIPRAPLLEIMFFSQVLNGILLPFILIFMLSLINNRELMGKHVNGPIFNLIAWTTSIVLMVLTVLMIASMFFPGLFSFFGLVS